jgi:hypothetical protein
MNSKQKNITRKHQKTKERMKVKRKAAMALAKKPPVRRKKKKPLPLESHDRLVSPSLAAEMKQFASE